MSKSVVVGIFVNYIRTFPQEEEKMFQAIDYLINYGIGGKTLELLTRKTFRDTNEQYLNRLKKEAYVRENGMHILCQALMEWYETWKDSFANFNEKNAKVKCMEQPIHSWLHCLCTGQHHIYQKAMQEDLIVVKRIDWEKLKISAKQSINSNNVENFTKFTKEKQEKTERLLHLLKFDIDLQIKEQLFQKRLAIFLEGKWTEDQLKEVTNQYYLADIRQFSSIKPVSDIGDFDYYLLLTTQAAHSVKYMLESRISRDKLFFISHTNKDLAMTEWIDQLKGRLSHETKKD